MTCREFAGFILDYLSGELPGNVLQVFEWHLSRCENCREYLEKYKSAVELGRHAFDDDDHATTVGVPDELVTAILIALHKSGRDLS